MSSRISPGLRGRPKLFITALVVAGSIGFAQAQGRGGGGGGGNGGGGGGGGETETGTNNLSFPAVHTAEPGTAAYWNVTESVFGTNYSYGCGLPETVGTTTYPNTSCVDNATGAFLNPSDCSLKCPNQTLDRIYWQKVPANDWWAQSTGKPGLPQPVSFLDWSDSLESVTWKTKSTIRVETTPFASAPFFDSTTNTSFDTLAGFQMWHVFGQGTNEQWGVRVREADSLPYAYQSPYAIIHTPSARLNIAKLAENAVACPTASGGTSGFAGAWNATTKSWDGAVLLRDIPYVAELNVGGKYVCGYNWALRSDTFTGSKAGWWRLTFYTTDGSVLFNNPAIPTTPPPGVTAIPTNLAGMISNVITPAAEGDTGPLYVPVIDTANNLTYLDICIAESTTGAGGGGGGSRGGGGGGGRR